MGTAIGLRAQKGGAVCVVVAVEVSEPKVVLSTILATGAADDRLALAPYAIARERALTGALDEAAAAVAEGRARQDLAASEGLRRIMADTRAATAALLVNRAGWIGDLLSYSLEWAEHVPVAEGLAVRAALRAGCRACGLPLVELDEKTMVERAVERLGLSGDAIEAQLKAMGAGAGKPWRKEQKLAALAAWVALAG